MEYTEKINQSQKNFAHAAIDAGADVILGHHAHILKGIEVYRGKVIFYSLCNFAFDLYLPEKSLKGLKELEKTYNIDYAKALAEYPSYPYPPDARKTIIAKLVVSNNHIESVSYLPVLINRLGQPEVLPRARKESQEVFEYMKTITEDQELGTKFSREGDEIVIKT